MAYIHRLTTSKQIYSSSSHSLSSPSFSPSLQFIVATQIRGHVRTQALLPPPSPAAVGPLLLVPCFVFYLEKTSALASLVDPRGEKNELQAMLGSYLVEEPRRAEACQYPSRRHTNIYISIHPHYVHVAVSYVLSMFSGRYRSSGSWRKTHIPELLAQSPLDEPTRQ